MITQEAKTISCATCDAEVSPHSGYCLRCLTPYELSESIADRGIAPRYLSVLGASGAGKTVYLGFLLDMLSKGVSDLRGLPNGAFSVALQQNTMNALQQRRFPAKTSNEVDRWQWVHCEITRGKRSQHVLDLVTPDLSGEALSLQVEGETKLQTIDCVVRKSRALMLLVDSHEVRDTAREQDFAAMKLVSYIRKVHDLKDRIGRGKVKVPIAIVFTKCDLCWEATADPTAFAKANLPGFLNACQRSFATCEFFATGVVGSTALVKSPYGPQMQIPLHIEPHGVVEPLEWIVRKL